jgi:hypothetical protein
MNTVFDHADQHDACRANFEGWYAIPKYLNKSLSAIPGLGVRSWRQVVVVR